jgi:hypothetical protein
MCMYLYNNLKSNRTYLVQGVRKREEVWVGLGVSLGERLGREVGWGGGPCSGRGRGRGRAYRPVGGSRLATHQPCQLSLAAGQSTRLPVTSFSSLIWQCVNLDSEGRGGMWYSGPIVATDSCPVTWYTRETKATSYSREFSVRNEVVFPRLWLVSRKLCLYGTSSSLVTIQTPIFN